MINPIDGLNTRRGDRDHRNEHHSATMVGPLSGSVTTVAGMKSAATIYGSQSGDFPPHYELGTD